MIIRKMTLREKNTSDGSNVRKFIEGMYSHPLYVSILEQLRNSEGFVKKVNTLTEDKEYTEFVSEISFENQETFSRYFDDPSVKNLYDYLEVLIQADNVVHTKEIISV
jgi:hypothetical protein